MHRGEIGDEVEEAAEDEEVGELEGGTVMVG
jgi:hypothetical protein